MIGTFAEEKTIMILAINGLHTEKPNIYQKISLARGNGGATGLNFCNKGNDNSNTSPFP